MDQTIYCRRSIRKFKPDPVERALIEQVLQAAVAAPSARNAQPWNYLVYTGRAKEEILSAMEQGLDREKNGEPILPGRAAGVPGAYHSLSIMRQAPVLVLVLNTGSGSPHLPIDSHARVTEIMDTLSIGASIQNLLLRATQLGLGSLWVGHILYAYPELEAALDTKDQVVCAVALGWPDEAPEARPRKAFSQVVQFLE